MFCRYSRPAKVLVLHGHKKYFSQTFHFPQCIYKFSSFHDVIKYVLRKQIIHYKNNEKKKDIKKQTSHLVTIYHDFFYILQQKNGQQPIGKHLNYQNESN